MYCANLSVVGGTKKRNNLIFFLEEVFLVLGHWLQDGNEVNGAFVLPSGLYQSMLSSGLC